MEKRVQTGICGNRCAYGTGKGDGGNWQENTREGQNQRD